MDPASPTPDPSQPLVSIIIPCYRQAHLLPQAVDSALGQTYPHVEVLVVNDGSDDNTEEVATGYGDRIRYIHQQNRGLSGARNTGIRHAQGAYLKFLDSDDHLHPETLAWQVPQLTSAENPKTISLTAVREYLHTNPDQFVDYIPTAQNLLGDLLRGHEWGNGSGFLYPAPLVRAVDGFDERLRRAEDWNFLVRLGLLDIPIRCEPRVGAYYRIHRGTLSNDYLGTTASACRTLLWLHELCRDPSSEHHRWYGPDLRNCLHSYYRLLVFRKCEDQELLSNVESCLSELMSQFGRLPTPRAFHTATTLLGLRNAEKLRWNILKAIGRVRETVR